MQKKAKRTQKKSVPKNKVLPDNQMLSDIDELKKPTYKVSDAEFLHYLQMGMGLYHRTARLIETKGKETDPNFTYSRQSAAVRASKLPSEVLVDIRDRNLDIAEDVLFKNMTLKDNPPVSQRACEFYLKMQGKKRGYVERTEVDDVTDPDRKKQVYIFKNGNRIEF